MATLTVIMLISLLPFPLLGTVMLVDRMKCSPK